jgi:hypothetical protein
MRGPRFPRRIDFWWWRLPIGVHFVVLGVISFFESLSGASPSGWRFQEIRKLRDERLAINRKAMSRWK